MPKSLLPLLLVLTLFTAPTSIALAQDFLELTNSDILTMVKAKLPEDLIIEKIQTSRCHFDTYPSVLAELKYKGVSDSILTAMLEAGSGRIRKPAKASGVERTEAALTSATSSSEQKQNFSFASSLNEHRRY